MASPEFRAGAATSNITPALGTSLNGGMQDRTATHIHDELHARCLVLDDGNVQLAFVVCDSCMIPAAIFEAAKHRVGEQLGLPPDRMMMSATHAHSTATVAGVFQSEPDEEYIEFLSLRIADGVQRAWNNLAPARIGWGAADEPTQVFNRRWRMQPAAIGPDPFGRPRDQVKMNPPRASDELIEPAGPIDPQVSVLAVETPDGRPIALLANYSLHYVGGTGGGHVSADYFGVFADRVQQLLQADRLDPPFVGIMSNGTSGNINNIDFRNAGESQPPYAQMQLVAHRLAEVAMRAYEGIEFKNHVPLDLREARLTLERRMPQPDEVARAKHILGQAHGESLTTLEEIYARETVLLADLSPTVETVVQAARIGELGIAALPCEVFVETGLAIKEQSPLQPTFTISLANDYMGYLPTAEHHRLGGYETWRARSSFLAIDAEAKLRQGVLDLLNELA